MNINEAYTILGVTNASPIEEIKKTYKSLARKNHPDINKDEGAEDKFKKINEAYQCILSGENELQEDELEDFNPFIHNRQVKHVGHISLKTNISFKESVLGCKKEITFSRKGKCQSCNGQGKSHVNNGCVKCGGRGQVVNQQSNMIFSRTCDKCWGLRETIACGVCSATGMLENQATVSVTIPGGVVDGNILRLNGMGNYIGSIMNMDQYTNANVYISVDLDSDLSLYNSDVIFNLNISLLEALQGTNKTVKTILDEREIIIPPLSKNKEEILLPNLGVNGVGSQKVILNVKYPDDVSVLINLLKDV